LDAREELVAQIAKQLDTFAAEALREDLRDESRAAVSYVRASNFVRGLINPMSQSQIPAVIRLKTYMAQPLPQPLQDDFGKEWATVIDRVEEIAKKLNSVVDARQVAIDSGQYAGSTIPPLLPELKTKALTCLVRTILAGLDALSDLILA
jgi:hypothetical protein